MTAKELQEEAEKKAKKSKGKDGSDGGKKSPKVAANLIIPIIFLL
jgi:hypothetical protein